MSKISADNIKKMVGPFMVGLLLLSATGFASCKRDREVIPEKKLVTLLADLEVAQIWKRRDPSATSMGADSIGLAVLKAHGVTAQQLDSTMGWYGKNADTYQELYAKVEKELDHRLSTIDRNRKKEEKASELDDLWPSARFARLGGFGGSRSVAFSIDNPDLKPGQVVEWRFRTVSGGNVEMLLGCEYPGGKNVYVSSMCFAHNVSGTKLYTDSAYAVKRLYGIIRPNGSSSETTLIDSISLQVLPFDSMEYFRYYHQKNYNMRSRRNR